MNVFVLVSGLLASFCVIADPVADHSNVNLADYAELCDLQSPDRDECFQRLLQYGLDNYGAGLEDIGLPQFDPLVLKNWRFHFDNPLVPTSSLTIKKIKTTGYSKGRILSVNSRIKENTTRIEVQFPQIYVEGSYSGIGRYPSLGFEPRGYFNMTFTETSNGFDVNGQTEERNGETFMKLRKIALVDQKVGNLKVNFDGLFPDPELNQVTMESINNNWRVFYDASAKEIWAIITDRLLVAISLPFDRIPFRKMFL